MALLVLSTIAVLAKNVASFNMAPNRLSRNGDNGNTIRTSPPAAQLPMAQRSASVEAAGDAAGLPDVALTVFGEDKRPVLLYDGVCNMCNGFVNRFLDIDKEEKFRFSALQSETGRSLLALSGRSPEDISRSVRRRQCSEALQWLAPFFQCFESSCRYARVVPNKLFCRSSLSKHLHLYKTRRANAYISLFVPGIGIIGVRVPGTTFATTFGLFYFLSWGTLPLQRHWSMSCEHGLDYAG